MTSVANRRMLNEPKTGPQAWRADSVDAPEHWYEQVPESLVAAIRARISQFASDRPITDLCLHDDEIEEWWEPLRPARRELEQGRGFVILEGLPFDELSQRETVGCYWLVGQLLGEPFEQNVQGTVLYDVRDTGQDVSAGARFSVTNYESSFHTDNSFGDMILDYVGLLCLKTAKEGGVSQNVSGYAAHNVLLKEFPDVLQTLYQPLHVDRRGGFREGESPTVERPVIEFNGRELVIRYLRYWIEVGHEKVGQPLTAQQRRALDTFDAVLARPELRVEFSLQPGQMYFINNRWILHNRTAFTDYPELEQRRHLVRLWLRAR